MFGVDLSGIVTVLAVLGLVIGVIFAFVIFFWFMSRKNKDHFTGWLGKLYHFLQFDYYIIEEILKFSYVLLACICTFVGAFLMVSIVAIAQGILLLVVGNLLVRIVYEMILLLIMACRNLSEMNAGIQQLAQAEEQVEAALVLKEAAVSEEEQTEDCFCHKCGAKCSTAYTYCNMCGEKLQK